MKMTITELRDLVLKHFIDEEGNLDIRGLDFSDFDGSVYIGKMKVKRHLMQDEQEVKGNLFQDWQKVEKSLIQNRQEVEGTLYQSYQEVEGNLYQNHQVVKGDLHQNFQTVEGDLHQDYQKPKELTLKEISDLLGYEVKIKGVD